MQVGVAVGVGVGVDAPDCAQYLAPVLKTLTLLLVPPQMIISLPVQIAVCQ
jgi:hypothetical protein